MVDLNFREQMVQSLMAKKISSTEAARTLKVTTRTIQNYMRRFVTRGPEGLKDHRTGNHFKLTPSERAAILVCKQENPQRSARLIRDRLGLQVSEEAVRLILVKNYMYYRKAS